MGNVDTRNESVPRQHVGNGAGAHPLPAVIGAFSWMSPAAVGRDPFDAGHGGAAATQPAQPTEGGGSAWITRHYTLPWRQLAGSRITSISVLCYRAGGRAGGCACFDAHLGARSSINAACGYARCWGAS